MSRRALIFGIGGQDGAYLSRSLLEKGYDVHGTSRSTDPPPNLRKLGIAEQVTVHSIDAYRDDPSPLLVRTEADEIYYLAAQSSVWRSFANPAESFAVSALGLIAVMEAARAVLPEARLLNAASGDCFGPTGSDAPATESTPFAPRSPYAAAKCAGHHALAVTRLAHCHFSCSAFLFNHESPLRSEDFVIGKVLAAASRIAAGSSEIVKLGNLSVIRDWGLAPDYAEAMWMMLQQEEPKDFVVASGRSYRLGAIVARIFAAYGLSWRDHVEAAAVTPRPTDILTHHADPSRARRELGWTPKVVGIDALCEGLVGLVAMRSCATEADGTRSEIEP